MTWSQSLGFAGPCLTSRTSASALESGLALDQLSFPLV
jgi:hypothetical protein